MGLLRKIFGHEKPRLHCCQGGMCDLSRIKVSDSRSAESYRWQCSKCNQHFFYSDSFLNGKKLTSE